MTRGIDGRAATSVRCGGPSESHGSSLDLPGRLCGVRAMTAEPICASDPSCCWRGCTIAAFAAFFALGVQSGDGVAATGCCDDVVRVAPDVTAVSRPLALAAIAKRRSAPLISHPNNGDTGFTRPIDNFDDRIPASEADKYDEAIERYTAWLWIDRSPRECSHCCRAIVLEAEANLRRGPSRPLLETPLQNDDDLVTMYRQAVQGSRRGSGRHGASR